MIGYIKSVAVGLLICLVTAILQLRIRADIITEAGNVIILLSDVFFLAGVLLLAAGGLCYASSGGLFDPFYYTFFRKSCDENMTYGEFRCSGRKNKKDPVPMTVTGAGFIIISLIFCLFV